MKTAIFAVTGRGAVLAQKIKSEIVSDADIYVKSGRQGNLTVTTFNSLMQTVADTMGLYDRMIFVMAVGIVVRVIAPHLIHKAVDPAVVVMDEQGCNAISLLAGHIGGANELTRRISEALSCHAVITTATDINHLPAADVFAVKTGLKIESYDVMRTMNAAIVNGDRVTFFTDDEWLRKDSFLVSTAYELGIELVPLSSYDPSRDSYAVMITDKMLASNERSLFLRPPALVAGIGCRRGTAADEIMAALESSCKSINRSILSIAKMCSVDIKKDEQGLLAAAEKIGAVTVFFDKIQLQEVVEQFDLNKSPFVENKIGVGNVCQAAAILGAKSGKVLLPKTKFKNITVAIAQDALW